MDAPRLDLLPDPPSHPLARLDLAPAGVPARARSPPSGDPYGWTIRDSIREQLTYPPERYFELEAELASRAGTTRPLARAGVGTLDVPRDPRVRPRYLPAHRLFLSEGCITDERGNPRSASPLNRDEVEYIEDVVRILPPRSASRLSKADDKTYHTTTLRAGSIILGHLFRDVLDTGVTRLTMRIPFRSRWGGPRGYREQVVCGIARGDGDVDVHIGLASYRKMAATITHELNTGQAGGFSSSPGVLAQVGNPCSRGFGPHCRRGRRTSPKSGSPVAKTPPI